MVHDSTFIIFTDGSSTVYKNKNGNKFGGIGVYFEDKPEYNISKSLTGPNVTNQKAELIACIYGIKICKDIAKQKNIVNYNILLYSDSMYTINCATKWAIVWEQHGWKRKVGKTYKEVLNLELVKELYEIIKTVTIQFVHVKSHKSEPKIKDNNWKIWQGNDIADKLASKGMMDAIEMDKYIAC